MKTHGDYAEDLFCSGCNCAQSVLAAYDRELGLDRETALKISAPFGGGMGRLREVCGALTGLFMVAGMRMGSADPNDQAAKTLLYQQIQEFAARFRDEYGSILCRDLLPPEEAASDPVPAQRTPDYYQRRSCSDYVRFAADLLEQADWPDSPAI